MKRKDRKLRFYKKLRALGKTVLIAAAAAITLLLAWRPFAGGIETAAEERANIYAEKIVDDAVYRELQENKDDYANFIKTRCDGGDISAAGIDAEAVSLFKSRINQRLVKALNNLSDKSMNIPLGNLTRSRVFSGKGPQMRFQPVYTGSVYTNIDSFVENAGSDQSRHKLVLNIQITAAAEIAGRSVNIDVSGTYLIADTMIFGVNPHIQESFTQADSSIYDAQNLESLSWQN
ncbi:MAG: sporulation protein YunB [Oscillospiraceae bacterium]|jgi:sporulation protein YunB|nr:sporulation protein YunB [Oscillospiraceae bacterium]